MTTDFWACKLATMRILLANHVPFDAPEAGPQTRRLADRWHEAGEHVRCLIVDRMEHDDDEHLVRRVLCRADDAQAELPFDVPCMTQGSHGVWFGDLTDQQLAQYREALRQAMDDEIAQFDPQVIHIQHVGLLGQLALEAGVPYLLVTYGLESTIYHADPRFRRLADEAAENAGRIVAVNEAVRRDAIATFGQLDGRIVSLPFAELDSVPLDFFRGLYRAVLAERFGGEPELR
jgi:hypothetical protein